MGPFAAGPYRRTYGVLAADIELYGAEDPLAHY